jgi:hypothetical protein
VHGAALAVGARLLSLANREANSPLQAAAASDVEMLDGRLQRKSDPSRFVSVSEVMRRNGLAEITETFEARPSEEREKYAMLAHGAQFVEVKVDPDLGTVRVTRALEVTACEDYQRQDITQPGDRWRGLGHRHGAPGGDRNRPPLRADHEPEPPALPRARQRGRPRGGDDVR